jgi:hypothetical protein
MSTSTQPRHGMEAQRQRSPDPQEEGATDMEDDEEMETEAVAGPELLLTSEDALIKQLVIQMLTPGASPEEVGHARATIIEIIRDLYIDSGGLPVNRENPVPIKFEEMTNEEIVYILENMRLFLVRSRKEDIVSRCMNICSNISYIWSKRNGGKGDRNFANSLNSDTVLRQSFVEVFIGPTARVHPLLSLLIAGLSQATNAAVNFMDGPGHRSDSARVQINASGPGNTGSSSATSSSQAPTH